MFSNRLNNFTKTVALAALIGTGLSTAALSQSAEEKGFEIAARSDRTDTGFESSEVTAVMTLTNAAGRTTTRELYFKTLERENEDVGDKSLTVFETPAMCKVQPS